MSTDSFRDFVLEQLSAPDSLRCKRKFGGRGLYFKTKPDTLPGFLTFNAALLTPSGNRFLKNYREVTADIPEFKPKLTTLTQKAACS